MSLADALAADTSRRGGPCSVCTFYAGLGDGDLATFDNWLAAGKPVLRLWRACRNNGLRVGHWQFAKHVQEHHHGA